MKQWYSNKCPPMTGLYHFLCQDVNPKQDDRNNKWMQLSVFQLQHNVVIVMVELAFSVTIQQLWTAANNQCNAWCVPFSKLFVNPKLDDRNIKVHAVFRKVVCDWSLAKCCKLCGWLSNRNNTKALWSTCACSIIRHSKQQHISFDQLQLVLSSQSQLYSVLECL